MVADPVAARLQRTLERAGRSAKKGARPPFSGSARAERIAPDAVVLPALHLDTSALVKLYAREAGSVAVRRETGAAEAIATSAVAYAEARAAFTRLARERPARRKLHRQRVSQLDRDWIHYVVVELPPRGHAQFR